MVAVGSLPGIGGVDPSSRLAFLEVLRRLVAVEAVAGSGGGGGGVTAHSALTGLTIGDDHTQYLNTARGDARYPLKSNNLSEFTATATTARASLGLGTAAVLNVAVTGNAAAGEVVKGNDTRLSDTRTPSANSVSATELQDNAVTVNKIFVQSVVNAKLANVASGTFKGRATAGVGVPEDLTGTQATALLDVFTTSLKGLVPSGGSATTFLRGDGTWQTIAGGGDMLKSDNLLGLTNLTTARTNLGLGGAAVLNVGAAAGTVAAGDDSRITGAAQKASNLSDLTAVATARTNLGLSSLATLVPPGTVGTVLRGNGTFAAPTIINAATGTPQALTAATDTYVTGSALALASRQQVGTILRWRMSISKTAAGTATPIFNLRWGTLGTTADVARFTFTGTAQTNVVDSAFVDIEVVVTTLNATTGQLAWSFKFGHNLSATGFGAIPMQVSALSSGTFDTTTANAIVGVSINSGTGAAWTMRAVYAEAMNLL